MGVRFERSLKKFVQRKILWGLFLDSYAFIVRMCACVCLWLVLPHDVADAVVGVV